MVINKKKLERQLEGVHKWFNSKEYGAIKNCRGTLNYFTGVGKTYTAILIIKRLFRTYDTHNFVILVPSEFLIKQWQVELSKTFSKKELIQINVYTPHYVINNDLKVKTNTLIVDEFHEYYGDEFYKTVNGEYIQFDNNLALTATYEEPRQRHKKASSLYPIIDKISEIEALKESYISPYVEYNLSVKLTSEEQYAYDDATKLVTKHINKFGKHGLELAQKCISGGKHQNGKHYDAVKFVYGWAGYNGWRKDLDLSDPRQNEINELWNPRAIFGYAQTLFASIRKRKNVLYNAKNKVYTCINLIERFPNLKAIIFSQSTAFADSINLALNNNDFKSVVYHSQLKTELRPSPKTGKLVKFGKVRLKRLALESIKSGESKIICTASTLDKGFDVQDIVLGITASGTSSFNQKKQRGGRVKRIDVLNPNKKALLINLYVKNTKDEAWLKKSQSTSTNFINWVDDIENINFSNNYFKEEDL
tara:strand:+ start:2907 stop:4337 length:1431 start_codon:yes stop_codon:yes gene_type:complete